MRIYLLLAMAAGLSFIGSNCGGSGVGDPCTPEDEYLTGFSGFSQSEVNVESRSFQCLTRVCLVNHFQGRVSCPYGQVEDPDSPDSGFSTCMGTLENRNSEDCQPGGVDHRDSCQVPDRDGSRWEDRIIPPVEPQLVERQADDAVYCSCRCGPPEGQSDKGANFCECPSGFQCKELVEDLGLGKGNLAGKYCIKKGTEFDPGFPATSRCSSGDANCNKDYNVQIDGNNLGTNQKSGSCKPPGAACEEGEDSCCAKPAAGGARKHFDPCASDPEADACPCEDGDARPECSCAAGDPLCETIRTGEKPECSGGTCPSW